MAEPTDPTPPRYESPARSTASGRSADQTGAGAARSVRRVSLLRIQVIHSREFTFDHGPPGRVLKLGPPAVVEPDVASGQLRSAGSKRSFVVVSRCGERVSF